METYEFTIDLASTDIGTRLDKYLTEQIPDQSRSYIQKLLDDNFITVNGKSAKSNYKLRAGDTITVEIPEAEELDIEPENIPLDIVYEDDDIIVINKPKGMVVHPAPGHTSGTLVNALMYHCKDSLSSINGVLRPGIVHRIDMCKKKAQSVDFGLRHQALDVLGIHRSTVLDAHLVGAFLAILAYLRAGRRRRTLR